MIIKFENVSCGYKKHCVVSNLNFSFKTGEATCILVANGIGKTTLFKTLLGYIELLSGNIYVDQTDISKLSSKERALVMAYVPQAKSCSYQFMVRDIVLMGRAAYISKFQSPRKEDLKIVNDVIEQVGIRNFADKNYFELSGGEQQMVLLARALAQKSKFILLDEPASNLDYNNQKKLLKLVTQLTEKGIGILMVSHAPEHSYICCKNSLLISKEGSYIFGKTEEVVNERNLSDIYGVPIGVIQFMDSDKNNIRTCYLK